MRRAAFLSAVCLSTAFAAAEVKVPAIFSDNMVLQRGGAIPVWGGADPGEAVTVVLKNGDAVLAEAQSTADADGHWRVTIDTTPADVSPLQLSIRGSNTLEIGNVLVGQVWVCSGQSNMEWKVANSNNAAAEAAAADFPQIRHFEVAKKVSPAPTTELSGAWVIASPATVGRFSAVGYYFGRELHQQLNTPVGLIGTYWGGTVAEAWVSAEGLAEFPEFKERIAQVKAGSHQNSPTVLFNGMIQPILPYGVAGAIWYQGESNAGRHAQYRTLLPALIENWRTQWNQQVAPVLHNEAGRDFPFYIVQLANFRPYSDNPDTNSAWAQLREAQADTAVTVKNTGLAVTIDIGDEKDIHPRNKQDVGKRLARIALADAYGREVVKSGPVFQEMKVEGDKAILTFTSVADGLQSRELDPLAADVAPTTRQSLLSADTQVKGFALQGEDGKWAWARATITGENTIELTADGIASPQAARYGWADNPVVNLYNTANLPAVPFATDQP